MSSHSQPFDPISIPLQGRRLIEASAGTGKTYSITSLYIRLLLGHGDEGVAFRRPLRADEILVVTFTNAATAELRGRIRQRIVSIINVLQQPIAGTNDAFLSRLHTDLHKDPQKLTDALRTLTAASLMMDEAAIFSIHGFCARMLTRFSFESGMPFELAMETNDSTRLSNAARDAWLELAYGEDLQIADSITMRWPDPASMMRDTSSLTRQRDIVLGGFDASSVKDISNRLASFRQHWLDEEAAIRQSLTKANLLAKYTDTLATRLDTMHQFVLSHSLYAPACLSTFTPGALQDAMRKRGAGPIPDHPIFPACQQLLADSRTVCNYLDALVVTKIRDRMQSDSERSHTLTFDDLLLYLDKALQGPNGAILAAQIREQYPVVLVDEFQDTDLTQYRIFDTIYGQDQSTGFFMIGDPKQAIYKFRGADIFTYINAKRSIDTRAHYNLAINYRSTGALIGAFNSLFARHNAFLNQADIPYLPAHAPAADGLDPVSLTVNGKDTAAMTIWHYQEPGADQTTYGKTRQAMAQITANEVHRLLSANTLIAGKPLLEREIAILVRSKTDAFPIIAELKARNIGSTFRQRANVFTSEAARNLWLILKAAMDPTNDRLIRAAHACSLLNRSLQELCELETDTDRYLTLLRQFQVYHDIWQSRGILPMLQAWMVDQDVLRTVRCRPDSERLLTDLRQLGELLQLQSSRVSGMHELMQYLRAEMHKDDEKDVIEDNMLRLESDENLVQIITIHAAKGLQFDVVMVPMAASAREDTTPIYHRIPEGQHDYVTVCDLSVNGASRFSETSMQSLDDEQVRVLLRVDEERLAEEVRLFYVAVTRARYKCYIGLANLKQHKRGAVPASLGFQDSAPGHLLLDKGETPTNQTISAALERWTRNSAIEVIPVSTPAAAIMLEGTTLDQLVREPRRPPVITDRWSLSSYSALTRNLHALQVQPGTGDDIEAADVEQVTPDRYTRFSFPRGAHTGVLLHTLFEQLDFTAEESVVRDQVSAHLKRNGFDGETDKAWYSVCADWVMDVLESDLSDDPNIPMKLRGISDVNKLVEMEFYFPLQKPVSAGAINRLLRDYEYLLDGQPPLEFSELRGMMKGFIDLTFTHQGKCYLLDYKSNHLGNSITDYAPEKLPDAIRASRYDLQYLIYTVAIHRYLTSRIDGYSYATHFGGVFYLYLRGMSGDAAHHGVYFDRPAQSLIEALDTLFGNDSFKRFAS